MFITQTNDFGSVIWKIEQHICQSKKVTNFTPPLPPKYSMLKHFDVIQKLVPSKDHFNNKKHYKCKNAILEQKNHHFLKFSKTNVSRRQNLHARKNKRLFCLFVLFSHFRQHNIMMPQTTFSFNCCLMHVNPRAYVCINTEIPWRTSRGLN